MSSITANDILGIAILALCLIGGTIVILWANNKRNINKEDMKLVGLDKRK